MASLGLTLPARVGGLRPAVVGWAAAAPAALLVSRLLPEEGLGLAIRLAAAAVCLLVLPGALLVRAVAWPRVSAYALAASVAASLALLFVALGVTFAVGGTLDLTLALVGLAALAALVPAARTEPARPERSELWTLGVVVVAGVAFAGVVWWVAHSLGTGDVLFHLGRARKLAEAGSLDSVAVVDEFRDGGLHPGYAFPLWHAVLALAARLAGVDVALSVLHLGSALVPLAFGVGYAAGRAVFGHWAGGVSVLAAEVGWVGLSRAGVGSFESFALPASATRLLLVPILLALLFAYLREPSRLTLPFLAAAALSVAVVHPSYLVLAAVPLAGFAVLALAVGGGPGLARPGAARRGEASGAIGRDPIATGDLSPSPAVGAVPDGIGVPEPERAAGRRDRAAQEAPAEDAAGRGALAVRLAWAGLAVAVPAGLFFAWLWPAVSDFASYRTVEAERARALAHYGSQLDAVGDGLRAAPDAITRSGPVLVAALLVLPLVALAARRWWAALAVGGMLSTLAVLLLPALFTAFVDVISVSQGRRLAQFLPVPFAVAGAAVLGGRLRIVGIAAGLALGVGLELAYQAEGAGDAASGGPAWPLWVAVVGAPLGIAAGILLGSRVDRLAVQSPWTAGVACAFLLPIAVAGFGDLQRADAPDRYALSPGLVRALDEIPNDDVVFAPIQTAYRVTAAAPVFVAATLPFHVADTGANRPYRRQRDAIRFFESRALSDADRRALLDRYGAEWVLVDKEQPYPRSLVSTLEPVYEDGRYILLRVPAWGWASSAARRLRTTSRSWTAWRRRTSRRRRGRSFGSRRCATSSSRSRATGCSTSGRREGR